MSAELPLAGKTALVTGASRGLGAVTAGHLAAAGARVILAARDAAALAAVARGFSGASAQSFAVDLAVPVEVDRLVRFCLAETSGVDILVNNAAIQGPIGELAAVDFLAWTGVFQVNFLAPARLCHGLIEPMRKKKHGKIINLSGGGATSPRPHVSAYGAAKCALVRFSETLAVELTGTGIDVNCVAPGAMNTRMLDEVLSAGPAGATAEYQNALGQKQAGGAAPENAAELITFLASPQSNGITGRLISAAWDDWRALPSHRDELTASDIYTLRRITPQDRGHTWK